MQGWPPAGRGQIVGLLGGSFDPAHDGHVQVTRTALRRFALDRVWWLVSPGNPLKLQGPAPMSARIAAARELMRHPAVSVTGIEAEMGTRHTAQTLRRLIARYPGVRFVWLMGADNLVQFHLWQDWRWIMRHVPVGVLARPGQRLPARFSPAARAFRAARVPEGVAASRGRSRPPAWCFVNMPLNGQSSTALRARGGAAWRKRDAGQVAAPPPA